MAHDVAETWSRVERWLASHAPLIATSLRPGAGEALLEEVQARTGHHLPEEARTVYRVHDGQGAGERVALFDRQRLLPLSEALELREALLAAPDLSWEAAWLPVAGRGTGELHVLDLRSGAVHRYGRAQREPQFGFGWASFRSRLDPDPPGDAPPPVCYSLDLINERVVRMELNEGGTRYEPRELRPQGAPSLTQLLGALAADLEAGQVVWDEVYGLLPLLWLDALASAEPAPGEGAPLKRLQKLQQGTRKALRQLRDLARRHQDPEAGYHLGVALAGLDEPYEAIAALEAWKAANPGSVVTVTTPQGRSETRIPRPSEPLVRALLAQLSAGQGPR